MTKGHDDVRLLLLSEVAEFRRVKGVGSGAVILGCLLCLCLDMIIAGIVQDQVFLASWRRRLGRTGVWLPLHNRVARRAYARHSTTRYCVRVVMVGFSAALDD